MGVHFRSVSGCVICGTKSSSSRFTDSNRFCQHFVPCFGPGAKGRCGDLCNACVLYIKRYLDRPNVRRKVAAFEKVLDSKVGAGPKHMKQIAKQQRRRESRLAATANSRNARSSAGNMNDKTTASFSPPKEEDVSNSSGSCSQSVVSFPTTLSDCRSDTTSISGSIGGRISCEDMCTDYHSSMNGSASSSSNPGCSSSQPEFRAPHPTQRAPGRNRYRRNFTLEPVKMPATFEEVDSLLREILDKNSEAVNLDAMQIHTAVQYQLRLRNRIVSSRVCDSHAPAESSIIQRTDQYSLNSGATSNNNLDSLRR